MKVEKIILKGINFEYQEIDMTDCLKIRIGNKFSITLKKNSIEIKSVMGQHSLLIKPRASNSVIIETYNWQEASHE